MTDGKSPGNGLPPFGFSVPQPPEAKHPARLLLVDDDPGILGSLRELLRHSGFKLTSASSGHEAQQHLVQEPFDLVLLDQCLPDMSGLDVMDFINQQGIDTNIIVISGDMEIDSAIGALERGAFNFLRKPFPPEALIKTIHNALQKRTLKNKTVRLHRVSNARKSCTAT